MNHSIKNIFYRLFSIFVHLKIFNLFALLISLYLSSAYLFSNNHSLILILHDLKLNGMIWSSILSVGSGYLINYFYDLEKDKIEKPFISKVKSFIKIHEILNLYLVINIISLMISIIFSFRLFLFFIFYQFLIWFYCHKLSKILFINNLFAVILSLFPFFALILYFGKIDFLLIRLVIFLTFLLFLKEVSKDLRSILTDHLFKCHTLPNTYGVNISKFNLLILSCGILLLSTNLSLEKNIHYMRWYFMFIILIFPFPTFILFLNPLKFSIIYEFFVKLLIFIGICSILLIKFPMLA